MKLLNSLRRGNLLFQNRPIYSFYHDRSHGKVKDKEHFNLRRLVQEEPGDLVDQSFNPSRNVSFDPRDWVAAMYSAQ